MRTLLVVSFTVFHLAAYAQDAAQMAAQQSMMQTQALVQQTQQQAQQQTQMLAQQTNDQMTRQAISAAQTESGTFIFKPSASVVAGTYPSPVTLRLKDRTRGTAIYYTTDGWTPTILSTRYTGPITVAVTTTIQAVAITGTGERSFVATNIYTIAGSSPAPVSTVFPASGPGAPLLPPGTPLPLVFSSAVSSKGLQVGDALPVSLATDLVVGGRVIARRGTPVLATVTQVDGAARQGFPGVLTFAVHSLALNDGTTLALSGTRTREGNPHILKAVSASIIPGGGLFVHGQNAEIPAGTSLLARVEATPTTQAQLADPQLLPGQLASEGQVASPKQTVPQQENLQP